jgi:putative aldouronate transport system substrate-binding protein
MRKVGVAEAPETLAEFESLMYKFANEDPDGNGKKDTYGLSRDGFMAVFGAFGVVPFDDKTPYWMAKGGKLVNHAVAPETRQALEILAKWYKDGVIDPEFVTGENQGGYKHISHPLINGRIGFTSRGNYYHWAMPGVYDEIDASGKRIPNQAGAVAKELIALNPKAELVLGQSIKGPNGAQGIKMYNPLMNFFCVGKLAEKEPGKVAKVLEVYNHAQTPDVMERIPSSRARKGSTGRCWIRPRRPGISFPLRQGPELLEPDRRHPDHAGGVSAQGVPGAVGLQPEIRPEVHQERDPDRPSPGDEV